MPCWQWTGRMFQPRSWRNSYRGADAILAFPGPSLAEAAGRLADAPRAGAVVIGANTSFPAVRPDAWIGCDHPECYDADLMSQPFPKFLGNAYAEMPWGGRLVKEFFNTFFVDREKRQGADLPTNAFVPARLGEQPHFVWGWTFFTALHLAAWMGCRRMYLVGVDLNVELTEADRKIMAGSGFTPAGSDDAGRYADGRNLDGRLAQINRVGMAIILQWLPALREKGRKYGFELIATGEHSAARKHLPYVPLAEAMERIARRARGERMIPPPADRRVHGLLANQAQWGTPRDGAFGVMTGSDEKTEWRLGWWFECLRRHYDGPVTFADFGMGPERLEWCRQRGRITDLRGTYLPGWFNKPVAATRSGYRRTVWIDSDAEAVGPIDELATLPTGPSGYAAAPDGHNPADVGLRPVNTGVIVFDHGCPAVLAWARAALTDPSFARGDQELLNRLIDDRMVPPPGEMPRACNTLRLAPWDGTERIVHWTGGAGDSWIRRTIFTLRGRAGELLARIPEDRPFAMAEIGVLDGRTSRALLQRRPMLRLTMVDLWGRIDNADEGLDRPVSEARGLSLMAEAHAATEFAADRREMVRADSVAAADDVPDGSLDLVFIDGDHSLAGCERDIAAWAPKLRGGGLLCGHDIDHPEFPHWGVRQAVERFLSEAAEPLGAGSGWAGAEIEPGKDYTWFVRKHGAATAAR